MSDNDTPAHREKREQWVDEEMAARKRGKMEQAEQKLELRSRRAIHEQNEADWIGLGANVDQMRSMTEDAVVDLEEHQFRAADEREERLRYQQEHNRRIWRRQDRLANQRRNVRADLVARLGREPAMDEFIAEVTRLRDDENSWDAE